ncbi:bifunctional ADP-dependent NAD(P)H-hydrate dehydratase/NAD(P)H-hydrate epimerase [Thiomicrospira microaerophila]|uniref:bifunctional ADP-dependent NAD(P)H-hydrate dehydratase/NAD(P)H-hydrate epimerase n=1 Tax=Thiomicrospira microaerophila TaxID=406020 RepID=UPI0005C8F8E0|nr:bifunctional ADP-dependent NAD(P)H-hydrate dehydratase/NAD(P)H-hydrate epimerase [Thiomicrospira microaerophila]
MLKLYTRQQAQLIDQQAIEQDKLSGLELIHQAAAFALDVIQTYWPKAKQMAIICGTGHNGGDGYALAKLAQQAGLAPHLYQVGPMPLLGDAAKARLEAGAVGLFPQTLTQEGLSQADLIVDGLFGIGLNRPIESPFSEAINAINHAAKPVLALDIPSGLDANSGHILGSAVKADITTSFIVHKIGLFQNYGPDFSGKVLLNTLDLSTERLTAIPPTATCWQATALPSLKRIKNTHKGSYGQALLIGGNKHMLGAIALAGRACLRAGTGLVKIISREEHLVALTQMQPELMCYPTKDFAQLASRATAIGIGPGLGQDNWAWQLYEATCKLDQPMVLDADALNCLALDPFHYERWVLTPHPAEAARLLEKSTQAIQQDRMAAIHALHKRYGGVIVLKGTGTLIYDGEQLALCQAGNPGMATGGMGDVLTGLIAGYIAQGLSLFDAARLGVEIHARAADRCIETQSEASLLPSDVIQQLSRF